MGVGSAQTKMVIMWPENNSPLSLNFSHHTDEFFSQYVDVFSRTLV